jgi:hypothetical protein
LAPCFSDLLAPHSHSTLLKRAIPTLKFYPLSSWLGKILSLASRTPCLSKFPLIIPSLAPSPLCSFLKRWVPSWAFSHSDPSFFLTFYSLPCTKGPGISPPEFAHFSPGPCHSLVLLSSLPDFY